jgi:homoserine kinase type II
MDHLDKEGLQAPFRYSIRMKISYLTFLLNRFGRISINRRKELKSGEDMSQLIREDIFEKVEELFAKKIDDFEEIHYGRLNLKWIVDFQDGTSVFIKQYNPERYKGKFSYVIRALEIQQTVRQRGVKCPKVYSFNNDFILGTKHGELFTVLETMSGVIVPYGETNLNQVYSFGQEIGKLHQALYDIPPTTLIWKPESEDLKANWVKQMNLAQEKPPSDRVMAMLHKQIEILDRLDFAIFDECRKGWAHWDMQLHNVLFDGQDLSAILDFDRMRFVYPDLDVARATLSSCFKKEKGMDKQKVTALLAGYQEYIVDYTTEDFIRALRLLWAKESKWWVKVDIEQCSVVPQRFSQEIEWLQENWDQLEHVLL